MAILSFWRWEWECRRMALIFGTGVARGQRGLHAKGCLLGSAQLGATAFESFPDLLEIQMAVVPG